MKKTLILLTGMLLMAALPQGLQAQSDYGLTVGGTAVTASNAADVTGDGSISFNADSNTLTLVAAAVSGDIEWDGNHGDRQGSMALTIALAGNVSVSGQVRTTATDNVPALTITKVGGAEGCELTVNSGSLLKSAFVGFSTLQYDGLTFTRPTWQSEVVYDSTNSELTELLGGQTSTLLSKAVLTSWPTYQLWIAGQQVTGGNNTGMDGWQLTGDAMNRLVLSDYTLRSYSGDAIVSGLGNLTVVVSGSSQVTCSGVVIKNVLATMTSALTFAAETSNAGTLVMTSGSSQAVVSGFSNDNSPMIQEPLVWVPQQLGNNITKATVLPCLGVTVVTPDGTSYPVTALNRENVLDDQETPTVQFDGHSRLVLHDATLAGITSSLGTGLEVYLLGHNTIENSTSAISSTTTNAVPLAFLTDGSAPGLLTYTNSSRTLATVVSAFQGFQTPTYQNNLSGVLTRGADVDEVKVFVPLSPIITDGTQQQGETTKTIDYGDPATSGMTPTTVLRSTVINEVLYTLADDGTTASDGYDETLGIVVLNTTMTDAAVETVNAQVEKQTLVPGTAAFAEAFIGMTFVVPAGEGTITIKNTQTDASHAFHLKVGVQEAVSVTTNAANGGADFQLKYATSKATYVYLYLTATDMQAPSYDGRRAGPKGTISGGIGGLQVTSQVVSPSTDDLAAEYHLMTTSDIQSVYGTKALKVKSAVTDLPASAFDTSAEISYIDLSATKVTGKHFNRSAGAFAGLAETTFVYLPAGNTATGPNFVIGGVCDHVVLADDERSFEAPRDFTASKAVFERVFNAGEGQYYTLFLPYAVYTGKVSGTFYEYDGFDAETGTAKMKAVTAAMLTANTPYIYRPTAAGPLTSMTAVTVKKPTIASRPEGSEADGLHGVYAYHQWVTAPTDIYCYSAEDTGSILAGQFAKVGAGTSIHPFRAYLRICSTSAPDLLTIDWGDGSTTGISEEVSVKCEESAACWYTLDGRKLQGAPMLKGIYIYKGKKVKK